MTEEAAALSRVRAAVEGVPEGTLLEERYSAPDAGAAVARTCPLPGGRGRHTVWTVLEGLSVTFQSYLASETACTHDGGGDLLEVSFCRSGRIGWDTPGGQAVFLGPGDTAIRVHAMDAGIPMTLPRDLYEGITVRIDCGRFTPPALLTGTGITGALLTEKFGRGAGVTVLSEDGAAAALFAPLFRCPQALRPAYLTVKSLELLLYLSTVDPRRTSAAAGYPAAQAETVRAVHAYLLEHMDQRITIDGLSRQFLMNPTTLKAAFKAVYGDSLAAHMKEHRMERAAGLLAHTDRSVADVARAVGYASPSRFSAAFRETYRLLPLEYRRHYGGAARDAEEER